MKLHIQKLLFYSLSLFTFLLLVLVFIIGVMILEPIEVIEVRNAPFEMSKQEYKRGERAEFIVDICKKEEVTGDISFKLMNYQGGVDNFYEVTSDPKLGCQQFMERSMVIPADALLGEHYISVTLRYQVNPFRLEEYKYKTKPFQVIQ